jgi:hypothetical protein
MNLDKILIRRLCRFRRINAKTESGIHLRKSADKIRIQKTYRSADYADYADLN